MWRDRHQVADPYIPRGIGEKTCLRRLAESNCSPHLEKRETKIVGKMNTKVLELNTRAIVEPYLNKAQFAILVLCQLCEKV